MTHNELVKLTTLWTNGPRLQTLNLNDVNLQIVNSALTDVYIQIAYFKLEWHLQTDC